MKRVGIVGMWQETNTYSSRTTTLEDFSSYELLTGRDILERHHGTRSVNAGFSDGADGYDIVPVFSAGAWPAGSAPRAVGDELLERLANALRAAGPLDGLLLNMHGAMVTDGHPDMERDTVAVVREAVGDLPTAAVLDLHANPSKDLAEVCSVIISYDTYPHVDMWERGQEAARLMKEMVNGRTLRTTIGKVPLLSCPLAQATDADPMRGLQERAWSRGRDAGVARVCLAAGFPYSDVPRAGFSVLVVADANHSEAAADVVGAVVTDVEAHIEGFEVTRDDVSTAVRKALDSPRTPVLLADVADNIGGGSAGDGTALLAELLAREAVGAIVTIADAEVARRAVRDGEESWIEAEVGGKTDDLHGHPVPILGQIRATSDGRYRTTGSWNTGQVFDMGSTAVIDVEGVTLLVTERPTPPFHREQFTHIGLDPGEARIITAKGAIAWRSAFGDVVKEVIEVATPGVCPVDVKSLPRETSPVRVP